jgi:DNA-binding CsgD family transcriptional regulator
MHSRDSNPMPEHRSQSRSNRRGARQRQRRLLLVNCGQHAEDGCASAALGSEQVHAANLLEALGQLPSLELDAVLLGSEFREEEQGLFLLEARRRGFLGPILHVVAVPPRTPSPSPHTGAEAEAEHHLLRPASFTAKEQAVLEGVSNGRSNLEIARDLQCSLGSVKAAVQQLFSKLGVRKRAQVVRLALQSGLPLSPRHFR